MFSKMFPSTVSYVREKVGHTFKNVNDWSGEESVKGKVIVVTGACSELGTMLVTQLSKRGANVIMTSENLIKAANIADEIQLGNPNSNLVSKLTLV
jgi:hypothetical protein